MATTTPTFRPEHTPCKQLKVIIACYMIPARAIHSTITPPPPFHFCLFVVLQHRRAPSGRGAHPRA